MKERNIFVRYSGAVVEEMEREQSLGQTTLYSRIVGR